MNAKLDTLTGYMEKRQQHCITKMNECNTYLATHYENTPLEDIAKVRAIRDCNQQFAMFMGELIAEAKAT